MVHCFLLGPRKLPRFTVLGRARSESAPLVCGTKPKDYCKSCQRPNPKLLRRFVGSFIAQDSRSPIIRNRFCLPTFDTFSCASSVPFPECELWAEMLKLLLTGWSNPGTIYVQVMHSHVTSRILLSNWSIFLQWLLRTVNSNVAYRRKAEHQQLST